MKLSTMKIALVAVFAAVQAIISALPYTIAVGTSGNITLGIIGGSLIGILLGPIFGGLAVLIGGFAGTFLNPAGAIFGIFSPIPTFLGAVGAGSIKIRRGYIAGTIILASVLAFYAHPTGQEAFFYPWFDIVAMIVASSSIIFVAYTDFTAFGTSRPVFGIVLASFIGLLTDHAAGSALAMWYLSIPTEIWNFIAFVYPFERIFALILVTAIAVPTYYALRKAGFAELIK